MWCKRLVSIERNLVIKNLIKRHKSKQCAFEVNNVGQPVNHFKTENFQPNVSNLERLAITEGLELNDLLIRRQDEDELENIFKEIAQGDADIENRLRLLLYEIMIKWEEESQIPKQLDKNHWEELLKLPSLISRKKYLRFLFCKEKKKESAKIKEALKKKCSHSFEKLHQNVPHIYYGLSGYSMFLRLYQPQLLVVQNLKALTNKLFAPPILFDCSYQKYMNKMNTKYCARQIAHSYQLNRVHQTPCSLQLVNLEKDGLLMKYLKVFMQKIGQWDAPIEVFEKSYLDLYPKERLVYLTPHTKNEMIDFKADDIFIIGAFVDKGSGIPASLAKAKEEGLRMAKFPLDRYLLWKRGTKSLTLNHVLKILLDMRYYKNWETALKNIPTRKVMDIS